MFDKSRLKVGKNKKSDPYKACQYVMPFATNMLACQTLTSMILRVTVLHNSDRNRELGSL